MDTIEPYKLGACTIYPPTGNNSWRIRWVETGRRKEKTATSREVAEQKAAEATARVSTATTASNVTVKFLAQAFLASLPEGNYLIRQEGLLRLWILPKLERLLLSEWRPAHSTQVLQGMIDGGMGRERVRNGAQCIRALISYAQSQGWYTAADDPLLKVWGKLRFPFVEEKAQIQGESNVFVDRDTLPTRHEVENMIKSAPDPLWGLAWNLASFSGLRWGELIALKGHDIDLEKRIVYVRRAIETLNDGARSRRVKSTKNTKQRFSIFPPSMVEPLGQRLKKIDLLDTLFPGDDGEWAHRDLNRRRWIRAAQRAGWPFIEVENPTANQIQWPRPKWSIHDLRHVAATWMIFDLKAPLPEVTTWLGHHSASFTFDKYVGRRGDIIQTGLSLTEGW